MKTKTAPKTDKAIELKDNQAIEYDVLDKTPGGSNLGRAEFVFCPVIKSGKIREVHIFRRQQRQSDKHYLVKLYSDERAGIGFRHNPEGSRGNALAPWYYSVCQEHKGMSISVYVPDDTSKLVVRHSSIQTMFSFE